MRGRQRVVFLKSGQDRIHDGSPQPPLFQDADALDGGATGGADGVLQLAWMVSRGQKQGGGTQEHLRSVAVGVFPGQAAGYAAIGQGLQELADQRQGRSLPRRWRRPAGVLAAGPTGPAWARAAASWASCAAVTPSPGV